MIGRRVALGSWMVVALTASCAPRRQHATPASWSASCRARLEGLRPRLASFGSVDWSASPPQRGLRLDVAVSGDPSAMFVAAYEDRTTDPTRDDATGPELSDPNWRPPPRIWDRWHDADADAATPHSAMVPRVYDALEIEIHHRASGRALTARAAVRNLAGADAAQFAARVKPALEACVHDLDAR